MKYREYFRRQWTIISWGAQIEVPPRVLLIREIILKLHPPPNPRNRARSGSPESPTGKAPDINSLVGIIRQCRREENGLRIDTRRKTTFISFTSGDFVSRKFVACLAVARLALILIDVDLVVAVVYTAGPRRTRALAHRWATSSVCVTRTFDAVWSTWERDKVKPWGHAVSGLASIPESFTRELIHPVPNLVPARSPRGIGLINPNRNLLSQSASTSRSQITRPMNLEPRANYTRDLFHFLSICFLRNVDNWSMRFPAKSDYEIISCAKLLFANRT